MRISFSDILVDIKGQASAVAAELGLQPHDKDDMMQEMMVYAWIKCQTKDDFVDHKHAIRFFTRKAKHIAYDMFRKNRRISVMPNHSLPHTPFYDDFDFVMINLNTYDGSIVNMIIAGYSQQEIADHLQVSKATMSRKMKRLIDMVRFLCDEQLPDDSN